MNAIEIRDLSKSFRGMYAVDDLNMTVPMNRMVCQGCEAGVEILRMQNTTPYPLHIKRFHAIWRKEGTMRYRTNLKQVKETAHALLMCLAGGALFSAGLGAISKTVLRKTSPV